jgi:hypothetical protein
MDPKKLLILIGGDPRTSTRPAEAVRIAAGVGAWQKVRVSVYFEGEAIRCLTEAAEDSQGGPILVQYLPMVTAHGGEIYVEAKHRLLNEVDLNVKEVDRQRLSELVSNADYQMNFDARVSTIESEINSDYDGFLRKLFAS